MIHEDRLSLDSRSGFLQPVTLSKEVGYLSNDLKVNKKVPGHHRSMIWKRICAFSSVPSRNQGELITFIDWKTATIVEFTFQRFSSPYRLRTYKRNR